MFAFHAIEPNPLTKSPSIWFYSPRCNLSCNHCILPFKTETIYTKIDIVQETSPYRNDIDSVVLYLGAMRQKPHIIMRYLNVFRARWNGLKRYIAFSIPNIVYLWKYLNDDLIDGFIFFLHYPLWGVPGSTIDRYMKETRCSQRDYLQSLALVKILETGISLPDYAIKFIFDPNKLRSRKEMEWSSYISDTLNVI